MKPRTYAFITIAIMAIILFGTVFFLGYIAK